MAGFSAATRRLILARDEMSCGWCGVPIWGRAYSIHHRKPRQMGGSRDKRINLPSNGVVLCGDGTRGCHGYLESHRATAYTDGFLLRSLDDRLTTPVVTPFGAFLLDDEGGRTAA